MVDAKLIGIAVPSDVLKVDTVEMYSRDNAREHRTDRYELVRETASSCVLRRGQPFFMALRMKERNFDSRRDNLRLSFNFGTRHSIWPKIRWWNLTGRFFFSFLFFFFCTLLLASRLQSSSYQRHQSSAAVPPQSAWIYARALLLGYSPSPAGRSHHHSSSNMTFHRLVSIALMVFHRCRCIHVCIYVWNRSTFLPPLWWVCGAASSKRPPSTPAPASKNTAAKMTCTSSSIRSAGTISSTWKARSSVASTSWTKPAKYSSEPITDPKAAAGSLDSLPMWRSRWPSSSWKCPVSTLPNAATPSKWPVPSPASYVSPLYPLVSLSKYRH